MSHTKQPWRRVAALVLAVSLMVLGGAAPARAADPVIGAAGDIACDPSSSFFNSGLGDATHCRQKYTSDMLMGEPQLDAVLALGDTQYEQGSLSQFQNSYDLSWGRLKDKTWPAIGNHEYFAGSGTPTGSGYFDYFNGAGEYTGRAGDRDKGYYSFDVGAWHIVALNSVCQEIGGCAQGSPQDQWLRNDLATHPTSCTLAFWHHPRYNSGEHGNYGGVIDLWQTLREHGADVVLSGHAHTYERFAPQDANSNADPSYGIRQFVVGTGGKNLYTFPNIKPNSQFRFNSGFGYLKLTLRPNSYDWVFKTETNSNVDSGGANCHGAPPGGPPAATTGHATAIGVTSARLNGAVNPHGRSTTYRFEYGPTSRYGSTTVGQSAGLVNTAPRQVGAELTGLAPNTTYHYRVLAESAAGTVAGDDRTFTTGAPTGRYADKILGTPGLLSYWRMGEEPASGFAWDRKGLQLGTYLGGPVLGQAGALAGDPDTSAGFDGVNDELLLAGPSISTSGTVEGWFKWSAGPAIMRDDTWADGWILGYERTGGNLGYRIGGTAFGTGRPVSVARDGQWHHFAMTKNGTDAAYYLDGALLHDPTGAAASDPASAPWHVMKSGQRTMFAQGQADEVAVYDTALSAQQVKEHHDAGKPDVTPPDTFIDTGSSGASSSTSASFTFSSTEARSTFRCRLDGPGGAIGTEASCASPKGYTGLADGTYTFRVHAVDEAGNGDASPAVQSFTIDTTAPNTAVNSGPSGATTSTDASFSFSSSEPDSTFKCRLDAATWSACTSPRSYSDLPVGPHTFEVKAADRVGNEDQTPASRSFTVEPPDTPGDITAPQTTITEATTGLRDQPNASFSFNSSEPGSFRCRLDGPGTAIGAESSCSAPRTYADLVDGDYTFRVYAVDDAGNADETPSTRSFTVDTTPPQTTIDSGPAGTTTSRDATFAFSASEDGSSFQCRLDMGAWSPCSSPASYNGLALGPHSFEVRATDAATNTDPSPAGRSFTVAPEPTPAPDTAPPDTAIDSGPSGTTDSTDATFSFSSSEGGSSFQCRLDGSDWSGCSSPAAYSAIGNGEHVFDVRAVDSAGNADTSPASRTWRVERQPAESTLPPPDDRPTDPAPPSEPAPETDPDQSPTTRSYRPRSHDLRAGRAVRGRTALRRLYRDDGARLEIASRRRGGSYRTRSITTTAIGDSAREPIEKLALAYDGGASARGATITLRAYNFRTRRWVRLRRPLTGSRSDRTVRWSVREDVFDFISATGRIELKVSATANRGFRTRTDLVRVTVVH